VLTTFEQALSLVRERLTIPSQRPDVESLPLEQVRSRILAEDVKADRDYPPFHRATRDGYAVRSAEVATAPVSLECVGQARAGEPYRGRLTGRAGCCVQIMTGAPLPEGTDAVVMIEHVRVQPDRIEVQRSVAPYENVVRSTRRQCGPAARPPAGGRRDWIARLSGPSQSQRIPSARRRHPSYRRRSRSVGTRA